MPVWYSGVSDEHRAVWQTAGLFDVAHMGVKKITIFMGLAQTE